MIPASHTASQLPWQLRHEDARGATAIAQQHGVSELLAGILAGRGVAIDRVPQFLHPTLRDYLPDPFHLRDMEKAIGRIVTAIEKGEKIAVFGDYDVDGATSTALLVHYFAALGITLRTYIPDRMTEGYGPSIAAFEKLIGEGATLIITVDCGTLAHEPIAFAQARGVDVIVLDHHLSSGALPTAHAVVNPNRVDETSEHGNLAAVGVTFLTLVALNKTLREKGEAGSWRLETGKEKESMQTADSILASPASSLQPLASSLPNLLHMLDLVALGTVCDVMPLTRLNRAFVAQGLKVMGGRKNLGLAVLGDVARLDAAANVYHLGFLLGPRINAGGRVGASGLGVELLTAGEELGARGLAAQLDLHNSERQAIESEVSDQAFALAAQQGNLPVILVAGEGWHPGVIGIVAGRLKEKFSRPAVVVALENGMGKASARSVTGADMGAAIHAAITEGMLESGGGHAMAAGFSVRAEAMARLHQFLIARMEAAVARYNEARVMKFDGTLSVSGASLETLAEISGAGPYGLGNPSPRFAILNAQILHRTLLKEKHLRLVVGDQSGTARLNAVAFNTVGTKAGEWLLQERSVHLLGELKCNRWQGCDTVQFMIDDVARVS